MNHIIRTSILAVALISPAFANTAEEKQYASPDSAALAAQIRLLAGKVRDIEKQMQSSTSMSGMDDDASGGMGMQGMGKMKGMTGKSKMVGMEEMKMGGGSGGMDMEDTPDSSGGMKMDKGKMNGGMMDGGMNMKDKQKPRGMGMMGMMGDMGMMQGMGDMDGMDAMAMPSALPGFPGASHLYHIGATGFFLNHGEHIKLTPEQQTQLNKIKETALLAKATSERNAAEAEQQLWQLTSAGEPDVKMIEEKIREIEKINGDQRLDFIRAVGEAAKILSHEQHQALTGGQTPAAPDADPAAPDHSKH
ncbi:MAG: hypothetical protein ABJQ29_01485 [Luteolibacter sp.]